MLTKADVLAQVSRLAEIHALPKHWPTLERAAAVFFEVLTMPPAVHSQQLEQAVSQILGSDESFFPKPGKLRFVAQQCRGPSSFGVNEQTYLDWEFGSHDAMPWGRVDIEGPDGKSKVDTYTPCPVCGAEPGVIRGRRKVLHLAQHHRNARIPLIGWSDEAEAIYAPKAAA